MKIERIRILTAPDRKTTRVAVRVKPDWGKPVWITGEYRVVMTEQVLSSADLGHKVIITLAPESQNASVEEEEPCLTQ